jgi:hypothetical protein
MDGRAHHDRKETKGAGEEGVEKSLVSGQSQNWAVDPLAATVAAAAAAVVVVVVVVVLVLKNIWEEFRRVPNRKEFLWETKEEESCSGILFLKQKLQINISPLDAKPHCKQLPR